MSSSKATVRLSPDTDAVIELPPLTFSVASKSIEISVDVSSPIVSVLRAST